MDGTGSFVGKLPVLGGVERPAGSSVSKVMWENLPYMIGRLRRLSSCHRS